MLFFAEMTANGAGFRRVVCPMAALSLFARIWVFCSAGICLADEMLPQARALTRYEAMKGQCPFAITTRTAEPEPPKASFAANWYVSGLGQLGGEDFVSIKSRDLTSQFSLY